MSKIMLRPGRARLAASASKKRSRRSVAARSIDMLAFNQRGGACESMRLSPCVLVQPDGWARGEREGYGEPCDVTSLSLSKKSELSLAEA